MSRRHVFRDLRPYVCTFPTCQRSEHLFESRHEWFEHEKTFHRREWFCSACHAIFTTDAAFREHLFQTHAGPFHPEKLRALIDQSERAIESKQRCCLCERDNLSPHLLQRHVGRHMQQLSLFVVPGSGADEESDRRSSESADHEERSEDDDGKGEDSQLAEGDLQVEPEALHSALLRAATQGQATDVQLLLDRGAGIESEDEESKTALHLAAENGHEPVVLLLLDRGADIAAKGLHDRIALHQAAENGHEPVVRLLLDRGADIDSKDWNSNTALHLAYARGHYGVVALLHGRESSEL
jgi:hypothetical protein